MKINKSLKDLSSLILKCKNQDEVSLLLEDLLTPKEISEIGDRINIVKMLKKGLTQREIAEVLGISVTTVSRGNRMLSYQNKIIDDLV